MQRSLRLAAHVISRDPLQLPSQLIGRMHSVDEAGIREVLEVARSWRGSDWLCPLNGNLDQPGAPLLMTLDGHTGEVTRLRVTSDGRRTISVSDDETMRLWDLDRGRELLRLAWPYDKGDPRRLTDDGQRVIAVSWEEAVGVWDLIRGRLLREFRRDGDWHTEVAVTSDGRLAISASGEGRLQAWNLDDGSQSFALECQKGTIRTVRLSPDDRWAVLVFADGMISACDLHRRRFTWKLAGPTDGSVRDVVVSPDGSRVALVGGTTVSVRDLKSGQEISVVRNPILEVEVAALTPDGLWALCGSRSGTIAGWDLQSGRGVVRFTGHRARVTALALTPDGRRGVSASCDQDQGLQVWELETGRVLRALGGPHGQCCDDIVVTRDGRHVVAAFGGGTFQAWDLESGNATRTVSEEGARFYRTAIDTDGRFAISVGFDEPVLQFWDLENGWKSHAVRAAAPPPVPWNQEVYKTTIDAVAVSPDGRRCAGAVRYHVRDKHFGRSCGNDEYGFAIRTPDTLMITLWDCESGREVRTLQHEVWWVEEMIFSPDGRHLVVAASDHYVEVWNTDLGEVVRRITDLPGRRLNFSGINLSADGQRLLWASDASISLLELGSGTVLRHRACLDEDVTATAFAPHNALVTAADNVLTVWDAATGEERHRLEGHDAAVAEFLVAGDGRRAVSRSRDQTLKVWDLENGRESGTLHCHSGVASALAITPDGKRAITGSSAGILEVWDLGGSPRSPTLQGHDGPVTILAVDARGRRAFSTSSDGTLRTWDLETFEQVGVLRFPLGSSFLAMVDRGGRRAISAQNTPDGPILLCWDLETNQLLHTLREHRDHFTAALLSPDGSIAITAFECEEAPERWSYGLSVWDLNEGKLLQKQWLMTCEDVVALAMTPDGETGIAGLRSGSVGVLGLKTGGEVRYLKGHTRAVRALAVTPDGRRVISGSSDSTLRVWGLQERTESMVLGGHGKAITHVLVTPDGIRAVSASTDGTCQVWDHQNGAQLLSLEGHRAPVNSLALSPDGRSLVSASADWTLKIWNLLTGHCLATFTGEGPLKSCVCVPDGRTVIVGEESGRIHFLRLVREHDG
jgi:WD40 repeat protein